MATLKYLGDAFECTTAIKGDDYIHLLDEAGCMVAAFDSISDFSGFTLENGSYTDPTDDHACSVAVVRDDGTIGKGGHACSDISEALSIATAAQTSADGKMAKDFSNASAVLSAAKGGTGVTSLTALATAMGASRIQTGTYAGNGKFGSGNKKTLTFNFPVQFFILHDGSNTMYTQYSGSSGSNGIRQQSYLLIPRLTAETDIQMYGSGDPYYQVYNKFLFSGNTVSWYAYSSSEQYYPANAGYQFNTSGKTYYYIAIG